MAQKKITDLTLIDELTGTENFPVDDSIVTYRTTANQIKNFVLPDGGIAESKLAESLIELLCPTASVLIYPVASAPMGWLLCDGSAVSRTTYANLFAKIGITHGQGDGSTTFNLPDYRGRFIRGVDDGVGREPYRASRTAMNTGGNTGDNVGSVSGNYYTARSTVSGMTTNTTGNHFHNHGATVKDDQPLLYGNTTTSSRNGAQSQAATTRVPYTSSTGNHAHSVSGGGDAETAPINASANYIIKF